MRVIVGSLGRPCGLEGWQLFYSYLEKPLSLSDYADVKIRPQDADHHQWQTAQVEGIKPHGKTYLIKMGGFASPEQAARLCHYQLGIKRDQLPQPISGSYYWFDLIGCRVVNTYDGRKTPLGTIDHLQRAGGKDIMVIRPQTRNKEIYIPFVQPDFVRSVDLEQRTVTVLWDPDF